MTNFLLKNQLRNKKREFRPGTNLFSLVWFIYGISIGNLPVIVSYGIGLTGSSFVILAYFIYRGK